MKQGELNSLVAQSYGVPAERYELVAYIGIVEDYQKVKYFPLNEDSITLFKLCIKNHLDICHVVDYASGQYFAVRVGFRYFDYADYPTEELATCAAMFAALGALKGIKC